MTTARAFDTGPAPDAAARMRPPAPDKLEDTGLSAEFITDLLLKTLYVQGARTGQQLMDVIRLPFDFIDHRMLELQQRRFVEVRGTSGLGRGGYTFELGGEGRDRAREALAASQYVGPAPVPLHQYREWTAKQSIALAHVTREMVRDGFKKLVLEDAMHDMLGPAINSAKSLFLYGAPGNGKTYISETIAGLLGGHLYIPHAIEVDGQILLLYDPVHHHLAPEDERDTSVAGQPNWLKTSAPYDRRFVRIERPIVLVGGELSLDQLDLQYDPYTKMYQAPFQLKSNGGVLILDDFGRQRVPPRDLLNRWIVPLEKRIDFLILHTGGKFPVPFDTLLIFATNLAPTELVEEAFLRRIHYKIHVLDPSGEEYREIFRRCCAERNIGYEESAIRYVYSEYYKRLGISPRKCHPRDILDHLLDLARFLEIEPRLTPELLDRACQSYFLDEVGKRA
jgi:predicted ATPase with chaperone activity